MKLNRKVFWGIVLILVISIVWVAIYTIKQKNEDYEAKIMSVMKEREVVTIQDIFSFGFERAYIFNSEDCYLDGKSFTRKYNLDISINQVKSGEADYVQRIVFVDES
jgi:hypothetical protein